MKPATTGSARGNWRFGNGHGLVDRVQHLRIAVPLFLMLLIAAMVLGSQSVITSPQKWFAILILAPALSYAAAIGYNLLAGTVASGLVGTAFAAGGGDRHAREYSEQDAFVAQGRIRDAVDSYHSLLVAYPDDIGARLRLAALQAGPAGDTDSAVSHYLEARSMDRSG
ncbi:MAG TPA: hypothetical protein PLL69_06235 [Gemmatimonadales bacterium]|nr:hypothetical protein [Gemmatimonadales bacterium]